MRFIHFGGVLELRDLMLATWSVDPEQISHALPEGFAPIAVDGVGFVSVVGFCAKGVRAGRLPAPGYSGINVRTYVTDREGAPAIFLLQSRVTLPGMTGLLLGAPVRPTLIRVRRGSVSASGVGVAVRYSVPEDEIGPSQTPPLEPPMGDFDVAYWKAAGVRRLETTHQPIPWQSAVIGESLRFDPVLALGFDAKEPQWLHYAERVDFDLALPPRKISRR
jgi:hypothetical protein